MSFYRPEDLILHAVYENYSEDFMTRVCTPVCTIYRTPSGVVCDILLSDDEFNQWFQNAHYVTIYNHAAVPLQTYNSTVDKLYWDHIDRVDRVRWQGNSPFWGDI